MSRAKQATLPAVKILDANGSPMRRTLALSGSSGIPYDAADYQSAHFAAWNPALFSPDGEVNPYRDRIVSRVRDLVRNDGWASGAVSRVLDNTLGATFRPISKPDYRALAAATGNKAFDAKWADEFGRALDASWRSWANDPGHYCDMQRSMNVNQIMRLAFRHKLVDGDALAQVVWLPNRVRPGRARYATAINLIDPDRLSNPMQQFDMRYMRGGVEIDALDGSAVAYHIRRAHQNDWYNAEDAITWDRIPRETTWGRPIIIHDYDRTRAGEHRGAGGIFAPILDRFRMLAKYDRTELDASIINATFAAFIQSPMDPQLVEEALGDEIDLNKYQQNRGEYHQNRKTMVGESRMLNLFPGETIGTVDAARPSSNFGEFESAFIRSFASAIGITEQQFSQDWRGVNFSSARAALLEVWKTLIRRRQDFGANFGMQVRVAVVEEFFEVDDLPLPKGAPEFIEHRAAYSACKWAGPGKGYPDPVADREGIVLGLTAGLDTLENSTLENSGEDWEEVLEQRALENAKYKELGLPPPEWLGSTTRPGSLDESGSHDPKSPNYRSRSGDQ